MAIDPAAVLKAVPPKAAGAVSEKKGTATDKAGSLPKKHPPKAPDGTRSLPQRLPFGGNTGVSPPAPGVTADKSLAPAVGLPSKLPTKAFGSAVEREKKKPSGPKLGLPKLPASGPSAKQGDGPDASKALPTGKAILPRLPAAGLAGDKRPLPAGTGNRVPAGVGAGGGFLPALPGQAAPSVKGSEAIREAVQRPRAAEAMGDLSDTARRALVIREVRFEGPRIAPDQWREWQPVVVLENTNRRKRAMASLLVYGVDQGRSAHEEKIRVLDPGQRIEVRLPWVSTWGDCATAWLRGAGAKNPAPEDMGPYWEADPNATNGVRQCLPEPRGWRLRYTVQIDEVRANGEDGPTTWILCARLEADPERCVRTFTVNDNTTIPESSKDLYSVTVTKDYPSLRGLQVTASFRVIERDPGLLEADDIAKAAINVNFGSERRLSRFRGRGVVKYWDFDKPGEGGPSGSASLIFKGVPLGE